MNTEMLASNVYVLLRSEQESELDIDRYYAWLDSFQGSHIYVGLNYLKLV